MVEEITLRKVSTSEEIHLDMVSTPGFILESVEWGPIKGTHNKYKYMNQVGESVTSTTLGTRDVTIKGWVVAYTERDMSLRKSILNSFVNPQESVDLLYKNYTLRFSPDETVQYASKPAENNEVICKFQIVGTAHDPTFKDSVENKSVFASTAPAFHFPLVISAALPEGGVIFGKRTDSLIASVVNNGSLPTGMRIVFKAKGSVTNPKLIDVDTQNHLSIKKSLAAGEEIEVTTSTGEKRVRGRLSPTESFTNYYPYKTLDSSWLQLKVGNNLFRYDADEGLYNLDVFVYFQNRFLEVQECY